LEEKIFASFEFTLVAIIVELKESATLIYNFEMILQNVLIEMGIY
jgi:hypothetical protein